MLQFEYNWFGFFFLFFGVGGEGKEIGVFFPRKKKKEKLSFNACTFFPCNIFKKDIYTYILYFLILLFVFIFGRWGKGGTPNKG